MSKFSRVSGIALILSVLVALSSHAVVPTGSKFDADETQRRQFDANAAKSIVELQPFRRADTTVSDRAGAARLTATLLDLNPNVHAWYLLTLDSGGSQRASYHLENPDFAHQTLHLAGDHLLVSGPNNAAAGCDLPLAGRNELEQARATSLPYAPLCDGRIYLRNPVAGFQTRLERVTDFLRDHIWKGDAIVGFVRGNIYRDAFREAGDAVPLKQPSLNAPVHSGPRPAALNPLAEGMAIAPKELGIAVAGAAAGQLEMGLWYAARNAAGVYVSTIQPRAVSDDILNPGQRSLARLDSVEASALDYLVAFDLSQFNLGFALGTDHPRLGWSARVSGSVRNNLPGPDGIADANPLVRTGMIDPALTSRVAATFTGGFKREHGGFKYGDLATRNQGSHYGFIEQGVIFSKLQPGLATLYASDDGSVHMKTWSEEDNSGLSHIRFARQNGVAVVDSDPATGMPAPGRLVANWGAGNWSGSADEKLRTLRAGVCLQESGNQRFLIYSWFSTATPSAMSAVFLSYRCRYAMLLDMNALELTYLAMYGRRGDKVSVEHIVSSMSELDRVASGQLMPRFLTYPDNRDFFYLTRRSGS